MLSNFCKMHNIVEGRYTILCDGLTALNTVNFCSRSSFRSNTKSVNIASTCAALKESIPHQLKFCTCQRTPRYRDSISSTFTPFTVKCTYGWHSKKNAAKSQYQGSTLTLSSYAEPKTSKNRFNLYLTKHTKRAIQ